MSIVKVECVLKGMSPLLMHAFPMVTIEGLEKMSPEKQAEYAAYRAPDSKTLYVPGVAVQRALVKAAAYSKGKGRATLQKPVAACVLITPEYISLGVKEYVVDSRPVVIPATHGRIIRHRPRLDAWQIAFSIEYDDTLLKESELRRVVDDMGTRVGLLDFRPEKNGPFGRSMVVEWNA
jgi:hypothetical protein